MEADRERGVAMMMEQAPRVRRARVVEREEALERPPARPPLAPAGVQAVGAAVEVGRQRALERPLFARRVGHADADAVDVGPQPLGGDGAVGVGPEARVRPVGRLRVIVSFECATARGGAATARGRRLGARHYKTLRRTSKRSR